MDLRRTFQFSPNQTVLRRNEGDLPLARTLVDLDVSFKGPKDGLRVFGFLKNRTYGSLPIRVYDPQAVTMQVLSAVGLVTANPTHVAMRNLGTAPVEVTPRLVQVGSKTPLSVSAPPVWIPAHASLELPISATLAGMAGTGVARATLLLQNTAPIGSLVGSVDQRVSGGLIQDIPFKSSNPNRYMRGIYPLRWSDDYTNNPMVANTSDQAATIRAFVVASGVTYTFPNTPIAPGATAHFDVDSARGNQTADSRGNKIPMAAAYGKFHWAPLPGAGPLVGLHGRTELQSLSALRSSSFSCGSVCEYQYWNYPYFDNDPFSDYNAPNTSDARETSLHDSMKDSYGNVSQTAITTGSMYPFIYTESSSTLSFASINNDFTLRSDTGNAGTTTVHYHFTDIYTYVSSSDDDGSNYCSHMDDGYDPAPSIQVTQPTATRTVSDISNHATSGCPNGQAGWDRVMFKIVVDQKGADIVVAGQELTESVIIGSRNDLNVGQPQTATATTNSAGQFTDRLAFCSPACPESNGESDATQTVEDTFFGTRYVLRPNAFVYKCSANTINGQ